MDNITVSTDHIIHWFNALRSLPDTQRTRAFDAFWSGQIRSKAWLVNNLNNIIGSTKFNKNIYIFGGWIGVLGNMLLNSSTYNIGKIRSIDLDPWCESIADNVNKIYEMDSWRFKAVTADMSTYVYQSDLVPHIVINTSSEHVTQEVYDQWYDNIPLGVTVVVQGNNYYSCSEHIRCSENLQSFISMNHAKNNLLYAGELWTDMYMRYMAIWTK